MAPAKHSAAEEAAFMSDLFADLDDSFFNAALTPDPSPRKPLGNKTSALNHTTPVKSKPVKVTKRTPPRPQVLPTQVFSANDVDLASLMDGMENCDWGDMDADFLSPKKNKAAEPTKVRSSPHAISDH
jgi:DNA replication ATP-dependent helicase Dna2